MRSASFLTGVKETGSVPFSVKETGDGLTRNPPGYSGLTCLFPCSTVCWLSHGHRCLPSRDSAQMIRQPAFIENGTDPGNFGEGCTVTYPRNDQGYIHDKVSFIPTGVKETMILC